MKNKTRIILRTFALILGAALAVAAPAQEKEIAEDLAVRNAKVIESLQALRKEDSLTVDTARKLIQEQISPIIDFQAVSSRATGKYWRRASDSEKEDIARSFRTMLERTYSRLLARYTDQTMSILDSKPRDDGKTVVTAEAAGEGRTVMLEYVFGKDKKIVDIKVEGLSLIDNYRRQFAQIAKKGGVAGLVEKLKEIAAR